MVICEECEAEIKRRRRCRVCDRLLCPDCIPGGFFTCNVCHGRKLFRTRKRFGRAKPRFHDTVTWIWGGIKVYARLMRGGEPVWDGYSRYPIRRGVSAEFVDDQYNGR